MKTFLNGLFLVAVGVVLGVFIMATNPKCAKAAAMTETPVVGAMTSSGCKIAVRANGVADVAIEYADNKRFSNSSMTSAITTAAASDYTAEFSLSGLNANDVYWYRVLVDDVVQSTDYVHKFTTFPTGSFAYKFAVFADVAPADRAALAYDNAKDDGPIFAFQIGDFDHRNPTTLAEARQMHRDMKDTGKLHGDDFVRYISSKLPVVHVWDDHDYCGNDTDRTCSIRSDMWKAFDEHWPTYTRPNEDAGLWHSFEVGDAEFFVLDLRSQRDVNTDTDNSDKSMLDGALISNDQKDWLKAGLASSTAEWKFLISTVTGNPTARPTATDAWKSFSTEREEIQSYIETNNIENVIMISGDIHTGGGIDDGTNNGFSLPEMTIPHTNLPSGNQTNLGTWSEGVTAGAKGYGLVTVTASSVTLEAYGANGSLRHSLVIQ